MPYPTRYHQRPIADRYGRAFWAGWDYYIRSICCDGPSTKLSGYRQSAFRRAFWAGFDMAKESTLHGYESINPLSISAKS
jgi:hypothetical protein